MNYSVIKYNDIANGTGIRTTLFVSGCRNHCKGCFQPETWDFNYGKLFTVQVEDEIINSMNEYTNGITLLGGDPMEPENAIQLVPFLKRFKEKHPDKTIWAYTGYIYENLKNNSLCNELFQYINVLVDGPFVEKLKDISLKFKGSTNQRVIDVQESLKTNTVVLYCK